MRFLAAERISCLNSHQLFDGFSRNYCTRYRFRPNSVVSGDLLALSECLVLARHINRNRDAGGWNDDVEQLVNLCYQMNEGVTRLAKASDATMFLLVPIAFAEFQQLADDELKSIIRQVAETYKSSDSPPRVQTFCVTQMTLLLYLIGQSRIKIHSSITSMRCRRAAQNSSFRSIGVFPGEVTQSLIWHMYTKFIEPRGMELDCAMLLYIHRKVVLYDTLDRELTAQATTRETIIW